ncbi:MAG TPA: 4Fe-4S binding protein [bacterium]|mgnify:CR=1 FL=1|nr:4Fe-4S binding protein [bacterium]
MALFTFAKTALRNLLQGPCTERYPFVRRTMPAGVRGALQFEQATCIYCGICAKKCPTGALKVDRATKTWSINRLRCISCNYCVAACSKKCLQLDTAHMAPAQTRDREVHTAPAPPPAS